MSNPRDTAVAEAASFVEKLNNAIIFPTIGLLSAVALLLFIWGCFEYLINANNEEGRRKGVKNITFGIIGLVVMVSSFAILSIFTATLGLDDELRCANDPSGDNCSDVFVIPDFSADNDVIDSSDSGIEEVVDSSDSEIDDDIDSADGEFDDVIDPN